MARRANDPPSSNLSRGELCTLAFAVPLFGGLYSIKDEAADYMVFSWAFILAVWLCIFFDKTLSPIIIQALNGYPPNSVYKMDSSGSTYVIIVKIACFFGVICGVASFLFLKRGVHNIFSSMVALFSSLLSLCANSQKTSEEEKDCTWLT